MDITLLPPSTILSRHSHLALLPSPFPNAPLTRSTPRMTTEYGSYPRVFYRRKKRFESPLPSNGSSPISEVPDEILLSIFQHLDWEELVQIRPVCRQWSALALTPALHSRLNLSCIPHPLPEVMSKYLLKSVRHLNLHLFPYPTHRVGYPTAALLALLDAIPPNQLQSLSLPFSAPYVPGAELGVILRRIGTRLEYLDLKGSGLIGGRWTGWLSEMGKDGPGLSHLDLGFTSISSLALPSDTDINPFRNLRTLKLASCTYLSSSTLTDLLADLPSTIELLDLSRLDHVSFEALWSMKVVEDEEATCLKEIKVVGIDHLTRRDVRRLKAHWEEQRRACLPPEPIRAPIAIAASKWSFHTPPTRNAPLSPPISPDDSDRLVRILSPSPPMPCNPYVSSASRLPTPPRSVSPPHMDELEEHDGISVNIVHSAILESEDEEGYRQFIGEVANGTIPPSVGLGLGVHLNEARGTRATWVEVDGGGHM